MNGETLPPADGAAFELVDTDLQLDWITPYALQLVRGRVATPRRLRIRSLEDRQIHAVRVDPPPVGPIRIVEMPEALQRAVFAAGRARRLLHTVAAPALDPNAAGWHRVSEAAAAARLRRVAGRDGRATLAVLRDNRPIVGSFVAVEGGYEVRSETDLAALAGQEVAWMAAGGHRTLAARTRVLSATTDRLVLAAPVRVLVSDPDRAEADVHTSFRGRSIQHDTAWAIEQVAHRLESERIAFAGPDRQRLAGLWTECPGDDVLVVIPPSWGRTKETTSLLAQTLVANLRAAGLGGAVLRLDYRNARGESWVEPEFDRAGEEAFGFDLEGAVADIRAAVAHGCARLGSPRQVFLVGSSFSGPICLRAAATDGRVTGLVQLMGAADIRDLIRLASGGIDVVAEVAAGVPRPVLNVLGVLMRPGSTIRDGMAAGLMELDSACADARRLQTPVLWILGAHDAFVDPERVRSVVAQAPEGSSIVEVDCGHVPSSSAEAIAAFLPAARHIISAAGAHPTRLAVPAPAVALSVMEAEYAAAPGRPLTAPRDYWRRYMQGDGDVLGYEVLAMTAEYRELMDRQVALLGPRPGERIADLGTGLGHLLCHLRTPDLTLDLFDAVPQLVDRACRRPVPAQCRVAGHVWDAASEAAPAALGSCDAVVMSLFLSVLPDAAGFLRDLHGRLSPGTRVVASTMQPDADLSEIYMELITRAEAGALEPPDGLTRSELVAGIRAYVNDAADLLERAEEGTFTFWTEDELGALFRDAGFRRVRTETSFGRPRRAAVAVAVA